LSENHALREEYPKGATFEEMSKSPLTERFLEIIRAAENSDHPGYLVLIESVYIGDDEYTKKGVFNNTRDLPHQLMGYASEFKKSTLEDIEVRRVALGAHSIINDRNPDYKYGSFIGSQSQEPNAATYRAYLYKRFLCNIGQIQLSDVLAEFDQQLKAITAKKDAYPDPAKRIIELEMEKARSDISALNELFTKEGLSDKEPLLSEALACYRKHKFINIYEEVKKRLEKAILSPASSLFDILLYMRVLDLLEQPSNIPVVVVAGGSHVKRVVHALKEASVCSQVYAFHYANSDDPLGKLPYDHKNDTPLLPKDLDVLMQPIESILEKYPIT
jgi:hypothetical protein